MRELYLTMGSPASGKSTFIKEHDLEDYTIVADKVRTLFGNYNLALDTNEKLHEYEINQNNEHLVWDTIYQAVERRMQNGETTFVDSTMLYRGAFRQFNKLRIKYRYKVYLVDFMSYQAKKYGSMNALIDEFVKRDSKRTRQVGREVITRYVNRWYAHKKQIPQWVKVLDPKDCVSRLEESLNTIEYPDFSDKFDCIKIIGDVHGEYDGLNEIFANHKRGTAYVFCGDLLDRGTKNLETLKFANSLKGNNIFFLRGNHEQRIEEYLTTGNFSGQFGRITYPTLLDEVGSKDDLDELLSNYTKRLEDYLAFSFNGKKYLVSHAGIEPVAMDKPLHLLNESVFTLGINLKETGSPYDRDVDRAYAKATVNVENPVEQIHGHRNVFEYKPDDNSNIINLCNDDFLPYYELKLAENGVKTSISTVARANVSNFVEDVFNDEDIRDVDIGDGIVAHNFTREVFNNNRWTPTTTNARGLFTCGDKIVGRGFKKFFNEGQTPTSTLENVGYPARVYTKWNGFLMIAFYDKKKGYIHFLSKGGSSFHSMLIGKALMFDKKIYPYGIGKKLGENLASFYKDPDNRNTSVLFEVINVKHNEHIIDYSKDYSLYDYIIMPLAIVNNDKEGKVRLDLMDKYLNLDYQTFNTPEELRKFIDEQQDRTDTEGFVIYGTRNMLKVKLPYYKQARQLRTILENPKRRVRTKHNDWYNTVLDLETLLKKKIFFSPKLALWIENYYKQSGGKEITAKNGMELSNFTGLLEAVNEGEELRRYKKDIKQEFEAEKDFALPEVDNTDDLLKNPNNYYSICDRKRQE